MSKLKAFFTNSAIRTSLSGYPIYWVQPRHGSYEGNGPETVHPRKGGHDQTRKLDPGTLSQPDASIKSASPYNFRPGSAKSTVDPVVEISVESCVCFQCTYDDSTGDWESLQKLWQMPGRGAL